MARREERQIQCRKGSNATDELVAVDRYIGIPLHISNPFADITNEFKKRRQHFHCLSATNANGTRARECVVVPSKQ